MGVTDPQNLVHRIVPHGIVISLCSLAPVVECYNTLKAVLADDRNDSGQIQPDVLEV